jgi:hypothetical protein
MFSNQKKRTNFKWGFSFLFNYIDIKNCIFLSPYSLLQSVPMSQFCVNCSAVHFPLVRCGLYQPRAQKCLNIVMSFVISHNWRHKNWSVENIFENYTLLGY